MDWFQNALEEDIPPEWMWPFTEALNDWFAERKAERKRDKEDAADPRDIPPMMQNEDPRLKKLRR